MVEWLSLSMEGQGVVGFILLIITGNVKIINVKLPPCSLRASLLYFFTYLERPVEDGNVDC